MFVIRRPLPEQGQPEVAQERGAGDALEQRADDVGAGAHLKGCTYNDMNCIPLIISCYTNTICCYIIAHQEVEAAACLQRARHLGRHCLSNATCLIWPHVFSTAFLVLYG